MSNIGGFKSPLSDSKEDIMRLCPNMLIEVAESWSLHVSTHEEEGDFVLVLWLSFQQLFWLQVHVEQQVLSLLLLCVSSLLIRLVLVYVALLVSVAPNLFQRVLFFPVLLVLRVLFPV